MSFQDGLALAQGLFGPALEAQQRKRALEQQAAMQRANQQAELERQIALKEWDVNQRRQMSKELFGEDPAPEVSAQTAPPAGLVQQVGKIAYKPEEIASYEKRAELAQKGLTGGLQLGEASKVASLKAIEDLAKVRQGLPVEQISAEQIAAGAVPPEGVVDLYKSVQLPKNEPELMSFEQFSKKMKPQAKAIFLTTGKAPDYAQEYQNYLNYEERKAANKELQQYRKDNLNVKKEDITADNTRADNKFDWQKTYQGNNFEEKVRHNQVTEGTAAERVAKSGGSGSSSFRPLKNGKGFIKVDKNGNPTGKTISNRDAYNMGIPGAVDPSMKKTTKPTFVFSAPPVDKVGGF